MFRLILSIFILWSSASLADETFEPIPGVTVEQARTYAADKGQSTKLEFRIENSSSEAMKLTGISTHAVENIQIKLSNGQILDGNNTSILIDREETLAFGNDGHEILLVDLSHSLKENETIGFNITLSNGQVRAWAHIHSSMG